MKNIEIFEEHAAEYDEWFDDNAAAYQSEILALRDIIPTAATGLEVGVGTGRFAEPLGIGIGVEPAKAMAEMARKRGIYARFLSVDQVMGWLQSLDFDHIATRQTVFQSSKDMRAAEPFEEGHGRGAFVAIAAKKRA